MNNGSVLVNVSNTFFIGILDHIDLCKGLVYLKDGDSIYRLNGVLSDIVLKVKDLNNELKNAVLIFYNKDDLEVMKEFIL